MAGHMRLTVWQDHAVEGADGCAYPADACDGNQVWSEGECRFVPFKPIGKRWFAQYTAPGYLDRTDPVSGETAVEACEECWTLYGNEDDPAEVAEFEARLEEARLEEACEGGDQ